MNTMNSQIKNYIEKIIIPNYLNFDKAHNIEHVKTVINESLNLAKYYDVNKNMVYVIAAYHDLGLCKNRETHHLVSGEILANDIKIKEWFSISEIQTMKEAIEDHRASAKNPPRSIYGKIISEADRIIDPFDTIKRTLQFSMKRTPNKDKQFYYEEVLKHLIEKYSEKGYITLWLKESKNSENLEKLRQIIKNEKKIKENFEQLYLNELGFI